MYSDAKELLIGIYEVSKLIYDQVQLVRANEAQCKRLNERVQVVVSSARGLEQLNDISHYKKPLQALKVCLEEDCNFIGKFTKSSLWFRYIFKAGSYSEEFQKLNEDLVKASSFLQLGLTAQQIFNREVDREDQKADFNYIKQNQVEIIRLNQEQNKKLQKLDLDQKTQQALIQQQLESMMQQLAKLSLEPKSNQNPIDPKFQVAFHELLIDTLIVKGSVGNIYLGKWEKSEVVIKMLEGNFVTEEQELFIREINIMSRLHHPQLVPLYGACLENGRACLVKPYYAEKDLSRYLKAKKLLPEQHKQLALAIAKGLQYLHNKNIFHRGLQSSNILIDKHGEAHLNDFGLCKIESQSVKTIKVSHEEPYWQSPETFERYSTHTAASDIYSYGIVLWEILTGQHPKEGYYPNNQSPSLSQFIKDWKSGKRLPIEMVPEVFKKLLTACWASQAKERPSLESLIKEIENYQPQSLSSEDYYEKGLQSESKGNLAEALEYYRQASDQGYFKAHANLGAFYLHGLGGLLVNKPKAAELFEKGAKQGHLRAIINFATMKEYGDGIPKDIPGAIAWYKKAVQLGDKKSQEKLDKLTQQSQPVYEGNLMSMKKGLEKN